MTLYDGGVYPYNYDDNTGIFLSCGNDWPDDSIPYTETLPEIPLESGDKVSIYADGCVQRGGEDSRTWYRYVNPTGWHSDHYYHGTIGVRNAIQANGYPMTSTVRILDLLEYRDIQPFWIPSDQYLGIGYEDNRYHDNGYWGHEDGPNDQCALNQPYGFGGDAFVEVTIQHNTPRPAEQPPLCWDVVPAWDVVAADQDRMITEPIGAGHPSHPNDVTFDRHNAFDMNALLLNPRWGWQAKDTPLEACGSDKHAPLNFSDDCSRWSDCARIQLTEDKPHFSFWDTLLDVIPSVASGVITGGLLPVIPTPELAQDVIQSFSDCKDGHLNWDLVSYHGRIEWDGHDAGQFQDDDYNMFLKPPLTPCSKFSAADPSSCDGLPFYPHGATAETSDQNQQKIKLEFRARETIDRFTTLSPFWEELRAAVYVQDYPFPLTAGWPVGLPIDVADFVGSYRDKRRALLARFPTMNEGTVEDMLDDKEAVVIGLLGLDRVHGGRSEIHPVLALAIHVKDYDEAGWDPSDDVWAIFVRNYGNEGYCSADMHYASFGTIKMRLPRPPENRVPLTVKAKEVAEKTKFFSDHDFQYEPGENHGVYAEHDDDTYLTLRLPPPPSDGSYGSLVIGEVHLDWTDGSSPAMVASTISQEGAGRAVARRAIKGAQQLVEEDDNGEPEAELGKLWALLTPEQRAIYMFSLPAQAPATPVSVTLNNLDMRPQPTGDDERARLTTAFNSEQEQDRANQALALCETFYEQLPAAAQTSCHTTFPSLNLAPKADAGVKQVLECAGPDGTATTLDGTGSSDADGDVLKYTWTGPFGTLEGEVVTVKLPVGNHAITLTVDDGRGGVDSDTVVVVVEDTAPPTLHVSLFPDTLWPPNHELVPVSINTNATDTCDTSPRCEIVSVTSNQPVLGPGSGNTSPDWVIDDAGPKVSPAKLGVQLRAERAGGGAGRVYTVNVSCSDASGNTSAGKAMATVVHDQGR